MKIKKFNEKVDEVESPCIGVCKLDRRGVCEGCKRTAKEIGNWWDLSNDEKSRIIRRIKKSEDDISSGGYYDDMPW